MRKLINLNNKRHAKEVADFLNRAQSLIYDPGQNIKSMIKHTLVGLGQKPLLIKYTERPEQIQEHIESGEFNTLFLSYHQKEKEALSKILSLFRLHNFNPRKTLVFLFGSGEEVYLMNSLLLNEKVDDYFVGDISMGELKNSILRGLSHKLLPTPYEALIFLGKSFVNQQKHEKAYDVFLQATHMCQDPAEAYAGLGEIHLKNKQADEAISAFNKGLYFQLDQYKCLKSLFLYYYQAKEWEEASHYLHILRENTPLEPDLIPQIVETLFCTRKYQDIYQLYLEFSRIKSSQDDAKKHISAGLAMSGSYFVRQPDFKEVGKKILLKAAFLSEGKYEIIKKIALSLCDARLFEDAYNVIDLLKVKDTNATILELEILFRSQNFARSLKKAMAQMSKKDFKSFEICHIAIKSAIALEKNLELVNELIETSSRIFPDKAAFFLELLEKYKLDLKKRDKK